MNWSELTSSPSFWSYELSKRWMTSMEETPTQTAAKVLICGGLAGVVTWASIFPLDVIKTRVQTQVLPSNAEHRTTSDRSTLLPRPSEMPASETVRRLSALEITRQLYEREGAGVFFRGLSVCSARAFFVNAVQV
ncbi:MAG: hypothetical protein M1823_002939 [Watsoniomyces obsoletus]|nr:MAG: hypothetical protein M1823_002939 [Watsoniomyces obsoletus]